MDDFLAQLKEFTSSPEFDWDKAKTFYYVAKIGSQSEAAKILGTSQPSLSRQLSILEEEMKVKLMKRSPFGLILTRQGQELFKSVEHFYLDLKKFRYNHIVLDKAGEKRKIRIAATQPVAAYMLSEHLRSYSEYNPHVIFEVITDNHLIDIYINDVDLAIRTYDPSTQDIEQDYLCSLEKKLFASPCYIKKYGEPKNVEDLKNHKLVVQTNPEKHPYSDTEWILKLGLKSGRHQPVFTSNSLECLIEFVTGGGGILSCYEEMSIVQKAGLVRVLKDEKGPEIKDFIIYPSYLKDDETLKEIREYLISKLSPKIS